MRKRKKYEEEEGVVFFLSHRCLQGFSHCGRRRPKPHTRVSMVSHQFVHYQHIFVRQNIFHVQIVTLHFWRTIRNFWWVAHVGMIIIAIFNAYFQYPLLWLQYLMYPWISPMAITQNYPDPLPPCSVCSTRHCKTPCSHLHGAVLKRTHNVGSCIITCSTQHCKYWIPHKVLQYGILMHVYCVVLQRSIM